MEGGEKYVKGISTCSSKMYEGTYPKGVGRLFWAGRLTEARGKKNLAP